MLRILLVDDHILFREAIATVLEELGLKVIIYQASTVNEAKSLLKYYKDINLLILDLSYPAEQLWNCFPFSHSKIKKTPILILTGSTDIEDLNTAIENGCKGYITKFSDKQQFLTGIKSILNGDTYISADMLSQLGNDNQIMQPNHKISSILDKLSQRQIQILKLLTEGHSNRDIATICEISEGTVKLHVSTILKVLGVSSRTQVVIKVNELNLI